jgi:hypothetical protein
MRRRQTLTGAIAALVILIALVASTSSNASVSPASATFTLRAGDAVLGVAHETKTVGVPEVPAKADIEIAIDTTGSMTDSINQAKADAAAVVSQLQGAVPDTEFAVVQFKDSGDSPEYQLVQALTGSASDVQTALNGLSAGGGGDDPEAYNLVFNNAEDVATGWRSGSRKFVVVIGDAQPHGAGSAGFAGCTDTSADPHGLNTATELAAMAANQRTLLMIRQVADTTTASLACYQSLVAAGFTGGQAVDAGGNIGNQIVSLITDAFSTVNDVHLTVASASPAPAAASWIGFTPASVGPVPAPTTQTFDLTATVPSGTPAGSYAFDIEALADGVDIGHQALTIVVPEKQLTLSPATASNPIGTSHTVTAHAFDVLGPYVGDSVSFAITAGPDNAMTGSDTTDSSGEAAFTYTNTPPNPGTDTITATDGSLTATAFKTWVNSPPDCSAVALDTTQLWPPNHKLVKVKASGATDSDVGDSATLVIDGVTQDEPVNGLGDGDTDIDAVLSSPLSSSVQVRSERAGTRDGRVYRLHYTATDTHGATCSGTATVSVAHDQAHPAVDSFPLSFDSTL